MYQIRVAPRRTVRDNNIPMIWKVITKVVTSIIIGDTDNAVQQVPYVSTIGMMHCLITDVFLFFPCRKLLAYSNQRTRNPMES